MAVPTNAQTTYGTTGNWDDLEDRIFMVSPTDTPFIASVDAIEATQPLHEWQIDALAAASATNASLEGDDADFSAVSATTRLSNTCQISEKAISVTGTQQATASAGRRNELDYQTVKRSLELRRDMETSLLADNAEVTGNATTARELGGALAWFTSNVSRGSGGSSGSLGNTATTQGTQRAFTEAQLKSVIKSCFDNGGDPDYIMLGSFNKQKASEFTGNATRYLDNVGEKLVTNIDVYQSDFGRMKVVPNRFQSARDAYILELDMWAVAYLRRPRQMDLAQTGDAKKRQVLAEYTLVSRNEAASGVVADLTTS